MNFPVPSSRDEMYAILKDIFYYYRLQNLEFTTVILERAELKTLDYQPMEESKREEYASLCAQPNKSLRVYELNKDYKQKLREYQAEKLENEKSNKSLIEGVEKAYQTALKELDASARKSGTGLSVLHAERRAELIKNKETEKAKILCEFNAKNLAIDEKISKLEQDYVELCSNLEQVFLAEKQKFELDILKEQRDYKNSVTKYNNTILEKLARSHNENLQLNSSLKLRYAEIVSKGFSKDQLVEMGYYTDAIKCVTDYYNSMPAVDAYNDMKNQSELAIYIEEYYQTILYMYKLRAS